MTWSYSKLASSQLNNRLRAALWPACVFHLFHISTELIIIKARNCFTFCARLGFPVGWAKDTPARWVSGLPALGILLLTKGAQESGVGGFLSPNMWLDLKIQLPGFFCLLVSMSATVCPGNVRQDSPRFILWGLWVELDLICPFQNLQTWNLLCLKACCVY